VKSAFTIFSPVGVRNDVYNPFQNERRGRDREIEKSHTFSDPLGSEATGRHAEESVFTDTGCNSSEQYFFFVRTSSCHTHTHTDMRMQTKKQRFDKVPMALPIIVLPVPGGPNSNRPRGGARSLRSL
jgi:hypothetical protein